METKQIPKSEVSLSLISISDSNKKDLKKVRNYFGEHDRTPFEHFAYGFLDNILKQTQNSTNIPVDKAELIKFATYLKETYPVWFDFIRWDFIIEKYLEK